MPGVPVEMRRMWQEQVIPRIRTLPRGGAIVSRTLKILGIGESAVEEQLGNLVRSTNPTVATYAKPDGIHVRLAARAAETADAYALIAGVEEQVRAIFGASIYGTDGDDLGLATAQALVDLRLPIAVAEAGLNGALCQALGSEALAGGLVLPRQPGGAEEAEALAMALALRARQTFEAPLAVSALILQLGGDRLRTAAAVVTPEHTATRTEDHRTDPADAPRRAVLLAIGLLRSHIGKQ